jgi:enterobactin synthetase component D / holo-[acyl-carrier protein] synthase
MRLLADLLPPFVSAVETREDRLDVELFPEEELALRHAVEKRRREFATGRACAREALAGLGFPPSPLGSGAKGEPLWPPGVVGSITHCEGYRACAVAPSSSALMLGIDAERNAPLREGVWEEVAHGRERELQEADAGGGHHLDAVLFSAKEAIFKAWYPVARRWLGFGDAELRIDGSGAFTARLLVPGPEVSGAPLREFAGRWAADGDVVVTAVLVPRRREPGVA